jgi:acetolactate synthase-1/2/3 large subunit
MPFTATMRVRGTPKNTAITVSFTRARSSVASTPMVEAKARVREHTRKISRSTARDAEAAPSMYVFVVHFML